MKQIDYFKIFLYILGLILLVSLSLKLGIVNISTILIIMGVLLLIKIILIILNRNDLKLNSSLSYTSGKFLYDPGYLFKCP